MFALACGGSRDCEIEDEYDRKCLLLSTNEATARRCVTVVGNYVRQCFGHGCDPNLQGIIGSRLINSSRDGPFCSGTGFELGNSDKPVMVTVRHCQKEVRKDTQITGFPPLRGDVTRVSRRTNQEQRGEINPALSVYDVEERSSARYPLRYMPPMRFAETVFQGYNRLIASRNKVLARVSMEGERKYNPLYCDSSPLCTIVHRDAGKILHTCQSSKGGSGGALYQKINGRRGIVAVNNGATKSGQVTENEGYTLLLRR